MNLQLQDRRVAIAGSSRGVGFAIARAFYDEGSRVLISGRNEKDLAHASAAIAGSGSPARTLTFCGDLTSAGEPERLVRLAEQEWGGLDILIANLGSGRGQPALSADSVEWERLLRLNLVATAEIVRAATSVLAKGHKAAIVAIGSIAGIEALDAPWAYGAAKAGLAHFVKQSARHLAGQGIRVNLIVPGNIFFPGGTWDLKLREDRAGVECMLEKEVPQKRLGAVEEIAAAAVFLASPLSGFTTGARLVIDGGQTRH